MSIVHGPFMSFEDMMTDAIKRAPYAERAFHVCLEEQIYKHMDNHGVHHPEEIIDRLAKQCGLVIDAQYFHGRPRYTYRLVEQQEETAV